MNEKGVCQDICPMIKYVDLTSNIWQMEIPSVRFWFPMWIVVCASRENHFSFVQSERNSATVQTTQTSDSDQEEDDVICNDLQLYLSCCTIREGSRLNHQMRWSGCLEIIQKTSNEFVSFLFGKSSSYQSEIFFVCVSAILSMTASSLTSLRSASFTFSWGETLCLLLLLTDQTWTSIHQHHWSRPFPDNAGVETIEPVLRRNWPVLRSFWALVSNAWPSIL